MSKTPKAQQTPAQLQDEQLDQARGGLNFTNAADGSVRVGDGSVKPGDGSVKIGVIAVNTR